MRAVLYLLAALGAAAYYVTQGSVFLGIGLIACISLYLIARWYPGAALRRAGQAQDPRLSAH